MIGLQQLSNQRLELYASRFPLEALKPYLLQDYRHAFATIVLYEDNNEVYHETGIFSFDASEPETFNYEEFRAPLIEEFHDRLAISTVENLFLHLQRFIEEKPLEDDPFQNLVFSISLTPPSRDVLLDWEKHLDKRLRRVLYDDKSSDHFQLFPQEVCVVYSHDNHFTSVTSEREPLILAIFEDILERHLAPLAVLPLNPQLVADLYQHVKEFGMLRIKVERLHTDPSGETFLLVTYPKASPKSQKRIARIALNANSEPIAVSDTELIPILKYHLNYTDLSFLPIVLVVSLMAFVVFSALYFHKLFAAHAL